MFFSPVQLLVILTQTLTGGRECVYVHVEVYACTCLCMHAHTSNVRSAIPEVFSVGSMNECTVDVLAARGRSLIYLTNICQI